jgi:hypothetical protein
MHYATLQLNTPAVITVQTADGSATAQIDVYQARRMLEDAGRKPSDEAKWAHVLAYLADKLGVPREELAESNAIELNDAIIALVLRLNGERQKKTEQIACSLTSTPESRPATATGP